MLLLCNYFPFSEQLYFRSYPLMHVSLHLPLHLDFSQMCISFCGFFFCFNKLSDSNLFSVHVKPSQKKNEINCTRDQHFCLLKIQYKYPINCLHYSFLCLGLFPGFRLHLFWAIILKYF